MRLLSLTCNHCGAPLEVPAKTRFLTCNYCSSRLEVHRSGSAVHTEVLEAIEERTKKIAARKSFKNCNNASGKRICYRQGGPQ